MSILKSLPKFERDISDKINKDMLEEASGKILTVSKDVPKLLNPFLTQKAVVELNAMRRLAWKENVFIGSTKLYAYAREFSEKRYAIEEEVMDAKHPRRVERLWKEHKSFLEGRYGREFNSRDDLVVMIELYRSYNLLLDSKNKLSHARSQHDLFTSCAKDFKAGKDILGLFRKKVFEPHVFDTANYLIGLLRDLNNPHEILCESERGSGSAETRKVKKKEFSELRFWSPEILISENHLISSDQFSFLAYCLNQNAEGTLDFENAFALLHPASLRHYGYERRNVLDRVNSRMIGTFQDLEHDSRIILKKQYEARTEAAVRFVEQIKESLLTRWEDVAPSYASVLSEPQLETRDEYLLAFFYSVIEGREVFRHDEVVQKSHIHGALRRLITDRYMKKSDLTTPLEVSGGKKLLVEGMPNEGVEITGLDALPYVSGAPLLAAPTNAAPLAARDAKKVLSLEELVVLKDHLDLSKEYYLLFNGSFTTIFASTGTFANGESFFDTFFTLSPLRGPLRGESSKQDKVVKIDCVEYALRQAQSWRTKGDLRDALYDANSDAIAPREITVITDIECENFKQEYLPDFLARAFMFRHHLDVSDCVRDYEKINGLKQTRLVFDVGVNAHCYVSTFEINGKFGFNIGASSSGWVEDVAEVGAALSGFLRETGVAFRYERVSDEHSRASGRRKLAARDFQRENLDQIIASLQGNKLASVLSYAIMSRKYGLWDFGESNEPCDSCAENYIAGCIYDSSKGEQWIDGVQCAELHDLSRHPQTFKLGASNLQKIHALVQSAQNHVPPFIKVPQIMPEFRKFVKSYEEYLKATGEAQSFWFNTSGGIRAEEEELEDDPELMALAKKERMLSIIEDKRKYVALKRAATLNSKYASLSHTSDEIKGGEEAVMNHWSRQLMIYNIYLLNAPKLLQNPSGKTLPSTIKMRFS